MFHITKLWKLQEDIYIRIFNLYIHTNIQQIIIIFLDINKIFKIRR